MKKLISLLIILTLFDTVLLPLSTQWRGGRGVRLSFAQAAPGGSICYGWYSLDPNNDRVVSGQITNNQPVHEWVFEGRASTFANIHMEVMNGTLDPFLYVTDQATSRRITTTSSNDQTADGRRLITIKNLPLQSDGNYSITVTRLGEARGSTAGSYRLSIEPGFQNIVEGNRQDALIYDGEVVGAVGGGMSDGWYFEGRAGQIVTIVGSRSTEDTLSLLAIKATIAGPMGLANLYENASGGEIISSLTNGGIVEVFELQGTRRRVRTAQGLIGWVSAMALRQITDPNAGIMSVLFSYNGESWQSLTEATGDSEARITNFTLPASGQYAIIVSEEGAYNLTLAGAGGERLAELPCQQPPPECPAMTPLDTVGIPLSNEMPASGSISGASPVVVFQFTALKDNNIDILMQRTGGDLDTFLGLADLRGDLLARNDGFDPASSSISGFTIPADGCYFVYASRSGVGGGTTQGTFTLTVSGIPVDKSQIKPEPPASIELARDINPGETAPGTITNDSWRVAYRFRAEAGGTFTATATRGENGDLVPGLALLAANGTQIDMVTANFVGNASNPLTFTAEADTYYFIVVQREDGADGTSSGDFTLTLNSIRN